MRIKVESFLMKQGNRLGKAAIEFESEDGILAGFHLVGFTICNDEEKGMFVLFPAAITKDKQENGEKNRPFFFLRPADPALLDTLQDKILDAFDEATKFNKPRMKNAVTAEVKA